MTLFGDVPGLLDKLVKQVGTLEQNYRSLATKVDIYDPQDVDADALCKLEARIKEQEKVTTFVSNEFFALKKSMETRMDALERILSRAATSATPERKRSSSPERKRASPERHHDPDCMIHVSNIDNKIHTKDWFKEEFRRYGDVKAVVIREGWGFVIFYDKVDADRCFDDRVPIETAYQFRLSRYFAKPNSKRRRV